ncbi:hypothetical protein [Mangrovicoccus sp. HB161399]|uniref:hypothetical protein n=1 Tax=Mangrovicoccus sp. HB161399 TaxID=2720392 RepID=UPI00155197B8|nr:hypothetical protein [Mangrovicoccus sp. HB161399]
MTAASVNRFEWLKAATRSELPTLSKVVATALAVQFADDRTGKLCPAVTTIAEFVGSSLSAVKRALKALVEGGWLGRTEGRGRGNLTRYTLLVPGKVVPFRSSKSRRREADGKGSASELSTSEAGSEMGPELIEKEVKSGPSHIEQYQEQKTRPLAPRHKPRTPRERPVPHQAVLVPRGSELERGWGTWLAKNGCRAFTTSRRSTAPAMPRRGICHGSSRPAPRTAPGR